MKNIIILFHFFISSSLYANSVDDLKKEVCDNISDIRGWCSQEKALHFIDLVLEVKPQLCVEIGVYAGASIYPVASALQFLGKGIVIAIDPWDIIECIRYLDPDIHRTDLKWWVRQNMDNVYFEFLNLVRRCEFETVCLPIRATAERAACLVGEIDILYLDGNHDGCMVLQDVRCYLPKVKSGGYIWLNDATWTDFAPAIYYLKENCDIIKTIDDGNCVLFKKK